MAAPVLGKLGAFLAWLFFQSNLIKKVYFRTVHSRHLTVRVLGFTLVALIFVGRSSRQFWVVGRGTAALVAAALASIAALGAWTLVVLPVAATSWVAWRVSRQPGDGIGHRAGWEGYQGAHCENTIEGMRELVARDNRGDVDGREFPYLEFDVQETRDGQLVVFHDGALERAFPRGGLNEAPIQRLQEAGVDYETASVQDLTASQLLSLHIAGRGGLKVPLLNGFLKACIDAGIRRSLAVEVKLLVSDAGRQQLIDDIRWYLDTYGHQLDKSPWVHQQYPSLGWAGVIAFPHFFAKSYGEYGSPQWRRWAREFRRQGIRVRACHFHDLSLIYTG